MYFVKQLIGAFSSPLVIAALIAVLAAIFRFYKQTRGSRRLSICAVIVAYAGSTPLIGDMLLGPLERRFPPLSQNQPLPNATYIVVLGSGFDPRDGIPVSAALGDAGLVRIVEGIRLARRIAGVRLILSGGSRAGKGSPAIGYAEMAKQLGVDGASCVLLSQPLDTSSEAIAVATVVGKAPFLLVTSASHMVRAMLLMERAGLRAIAAPTGQFVGGSTAKSWRQWLPDSEGLRMTESALHEYAGLAAMYLGIK